MEVLLDVLLDVLLGVLLDVHDGYKKNEWSFFNWL